MIQLVNDAKKKEEEAQKQKGKHTANDQPHTMEISLRDIDTCSHSNPKSMLEKRSIHLVPVKRFPLAIRTIFTVITLGLYMVTCKLSYRAKLFLEYHSAKHNKTTHLIVTINGRKKVYAIEKYSAKCLPHYRAKHYARNGEIRVSDTNLRRVIFDYTTNEFVLYTGDIFDLSTEELRLFYGPNRIDLGIKPFYEIFEKHLFDVEFLWESAVVILWASLEFYKYSIVTSSIYLTLFVQNMIRNIKYNNKLKREKERLDKIQMVKYDMMGNRVHVPYTAIYPGDEVEIEVDTEMKCDVQLVNGSVVVEETFLTGEATPISKVAGDMIYSGTRVLQVNSTTASGFVINTGYRTKKELMLQNREAEQKGENKFKEQTFNVSVGMLVPLLLVTSSYLIFLARNCSIGASVVYLLDFFATVFSPLLFVIHEFGILRAVKTLVEEHIETNDQQRLLAAGETEIVVFDKTGTLTDIDLTLICVDSLDKLHCTGNTLKYEMVVCMATCHQITLIKNEPRGDILDMRMFEFIGGEISQSTGEVAALGHRFKILKLFGFSGELKRCTAIVEDIGTKNLYVVTKGAFETTQMLSREVPSVYSTKLRNHETEGNRCIGMAYKQIEREELENGREYFEKNMIFIGLLVFTNKIKDEAFDVVSELHKAKIGTKICTGDSVTTAMVVATKLGISRNVQEYNPKSNWCGDLALSETDYEMIKNSFDFNSIMSRTKVFARCKPDTKKAVVDWHSRSGSKRTMFVGDGANDGPALHAANCSLFLSPNKSTFGSFRAENLVSLLKTIDEGKCALVTGLSQFKFIFYAQLLTGIQMAVMLNNYAFTGDTCSLVTDILCFYGLGNLLIYFKSTQRKHKLNKARPVIKLYKQIALLVAELFVIWGIYMFTCFKYVESNRTFVPDYNTLTPLNEISNQAFILWIVSIWVVILKVFHFANYRSFKEKAYTNWRFVVFILAAMVVTTLIVFFSSIEHEYMCEEIAIPFITDYELKVTLILMGVTTGVVTGFNSLMNNVIIKE